MTHNPEDEQQRYVEEQIKSAKDGQFPPSKSKDQALNGSMVNDMDDLKRLGKEMDEMRSNQEDKKLGLIPDPKE